VNPAAILSTLATLILAEMGDKTQFAALALSLCNDGSRLRIFAGCTIGFFLANIVAIGLGGFLSSILPYMVIKIISAIAFLIFGILLIKRGEKTVTSIVGGRCSLISSTILIGSLELGDKTNLATLGLATYFGLQSIYELMLGLMLASITLMGVAFASASLVSKYISVAGIRHISALILIAVALYIIMDTLAIDALS